MPSFVFRIMKFRVFVSWTFFRYSVVDFLSLERAESGIWILNLLSARVTELKSWNHFMQHNTQYNLKYWARVV